MSVLKFRVWNPKLMSMHEMAGDVIFKPKGCIVMQATGKLDKSGHDIYEEDILGFGDPKGYRVYWDAIEARWTADYGNPNWTFREIVEMTEVIGNSYQNPSLIK